MEQTTNFLVHIRPVDDALTYPSNALDTRSRGQFIAQQWKSNLQNENPICHDGPDRNFKVGGIDLTRSFLQFIGSSGFPFSRPGPRTTMKDNRG
jgi:hypothetical protein